jgi:hypothetical protein
VMAARGNKQAGWILENGVLHMFFHFQYIALISVRVIEENVWENFLRMVLVNRVAKNRGSKLRGQKFNKLSGI